MEKSLRTCDAVTPPASARFAEKTFTKPKDLSRFRALLYLEILKMHFLLMFIKTFSNSLDVRVNLEKQNSVAFDYTQKIRKSSVIGIFFTLVYKNFIEQEVF
jgi:hypothetical protein